MSNINLRWIVRRDMNEVLEIDKEAFGEPLCWSEAQFTEKLKERNIIAMVAEREDRIVGFMVYELNNNKVSLVRIAVAKHHLRSKVGSSLLDKLKSTSSATKRSTIFVEVNERNLTAQQFFVSMGFKGKLVKRKGEDTIKFTYGVPNTQEDAVERYVPINRLKAYPFTETGV